MEIYYTRHGQTIANIKSIIQGQEGGELTEEGFNQVSLLGKRLSEIKFDSVYCSDLNRTKQTFQTILKELKYPPLEKNIHYVESLREINVNSLIGQPREIEINLRNNPLHPYRFNKTGENDENYYDVFLRISLFIDEILKENFGKNYNSGINKENNEEINTKEKEILIDEANKNWEKGLYTNKEADEKNKNEKLKRILLISHGAILTEITNNFLWRMGLNICKDFCAPNTSLFSLKIYKKNKNKEILNNNVLDFSFQIFNDNSHLNKI